MENKIIFMLGVSGSGKGTVIKELLKHLDLAYAPSYTTRTMRQGESDSNPYHFITREAFEAKMAEGSILEHNSYADNYYGTGLDVLEEALSQGKSPIKEIDINGLDKIQQEGKLKHPYMTIFLDIDDVTMTTRILGRQPDMEADELQKRLNAASKERELSSRLCDHVIDASKPLAEVVDAVASVL